jgi:hypothetical protein
VPHRSTLILVTEPTMSNGVWHLAAFEWVGVRRFTRHEIEDSPLPWPTRKVMEETDLRVEFDYWLDTMPRVECMHERAFFEERRLFVDDSVQILARARGWFALSDDEVLTERMLALVNTDKIDGMGTRYYVGPAEELWHSARQHSLLRPRTADNDINSNFTTGPLRVHRRYSVDWTDWLGIYGTMSGVQDDTNRAMAALIDAAMLSNVPPPPVDPVHPVLRELHERTAAQVLNDAFNAGDGASPPSDPATDSSGTTGDGT